MRPRQPLITERPNPHPPGMHTAMATVPRFRIQALTILWPAFVMAGVLEMLVFALVDPASLHWFGSAPVELSPTGIYTLAFFVFWAVISTAGALTQLLQQAPADVRTKPLANSSHR